MSPTKRSSIVHTTFDVRFLTAIRAARFLLAAAAFLAIACPASGVSVTWTDATSDDLWSTITGGAGTGNWSGGAAAANDVKFTNTDAFATAGTTTNIVDSNQSISSLQYNEIAATGTLNYHTTNINSGVTLTVNGSIPLGTDTSLPGPYSLYVGGGLNVDNGGNETYAAISGGGTLNVNNTAASIVVRSTGNSAGGYALLDMRGLTQFTATASQLLIGYGSSGATAENRVGGGIVYLAQNNTINLSSTNANEALVVGAASTGNAGNAAYLYLGQTNVIYANSVCVGGGKGTGTIAFSSAFSSPSLVLRGIGSTPATPVPVANIELGDGTGRNTSGSPSSTGTIDLTAGTADILATNIYLGRTRTATNDSAARSYTGTLSFNAGTVSTTSLYLGYGQAANATYSQNAIGTVNVGGTGTLNVTGNATLARFVGGASTLMGTGTGTINITGGTVNVTGNINANVLGTGTYAGTSLVGNINMSSGSLIVGGSITKGTFATGTSTTAINLTGGTLSMTHAGGGDIGSASAPIDTLSIRGGSSVTGLGNLGVINLSVAGPLSVGGSLTVGNGGSINMNDVAANVIPVTSNMTLSGASTLYFDLSNNTASGNDQIAVGGNLSIGGTTNINVTPLNTGFTTGDYNLITYGGTGTFTGATFNVNNTTRSTMTINTPSTTPGIIQLHIASYVTPHSLIWSGGATNTWSLYSTYWTDTAGSPMYYDLDAVTFDDTNSPAGSTVTLNSTVLPGSVTFNNTAQNYQITGTGKISGLSGLTMAGAGTLTLSTSNDYSGQTRVQGGTLYIDTGNIGNNSAVYITGGTLKTGVDNALGSTTAVGTTISNGGTLDLNGVQMANEMITVSGDGVGSLGAIVNNNIATSSKFNSGGNGNLRFVTLAGNTTIGGTGDGVTVNSARWDIRGTGAYLSTGGNSYNLTKAGNNEICLVSVTVDPMLGDVNVNGGDLGIESATTLGDPTKTATIASGATLHMYNLSNPLNKNIVLNGGTLSAISTSGANQNVVAGNITVNSAGSILRATGANVIMTVNGSVSGSAGTTLTKNGTSTLILANASNPFSGTTSLSEGTLVVNGSLGGDVTMATGTTLAGTGTINGTTTDAFGAIIAPGPTSAAKSVGTLNLNNLTLSGGSTINLDLSTDPTQVGGANDLLNITGTLSLSVPTSLAITPVSGFLSNGTYRLMNYVGGTPSASNFTVSGVPTDSRQTYVPNTSTPNQVNLIVSGSPANLTWKGDGVFNNWDVKTTANWYNSGPPVVNPDLFYTNDNVTFDDSTANSYVQINATNVRPASITVNTANTYTFVGGYITGNTGITKAGIGTLILANGASGTKNDFSGTTYINAGTLQVGNNTSNTNIGTGAVVNNASLVFYQSDNNTVPGVISGSGSLQQKGSAVLTISGSNTYDGVTLVSSGTFQAGNNSALGSTVGGTTIANTATLDINAANLGAEAITVQGAGTDGYSGAIVNGLNTGGATPAASQNALRFVTLAGDTTFGGTARWDIRTDTPATVPASLTGNGYNLTKTGTNQIYLVNLGNVDLGNVNVTTGEFGLQGTTAFIDGATSDLAKPITVSSGAVLSLYGLTTNVVNKALLLQGGTLQTNTGAGTTNTYGGQITIDPAYGVGNISTAPSTAIIVTGNIVGLSSGASLTLSKSGTAAGSGGSVTLAGTNTFDGLTNLNGGTLIVTGSLAGGVTIANAGSTLSGTGAIAGASSDGSGTIIAPGATAANGAIGTLNFGGDLSLGLGGQGQVNMDLTISPSGTNDLINVGGNLSEYGETIQINPVNSFLGMGTYHLIHYNGTLYGSASAMTLTGIPVNTRSTYTLADAANYLNLVVGGTPPANLVWTGNGGTNAWDLVNPANLMWSNGGTADTFYNMDQVTFNDAGSNTPAVNLTAIVIPSSVIVNSSHDYTISGTGRISGAATVTKSGAGTLTVSTSNDYAGVTTINGGTLRVGVAGALGSGSGATIINGGSLDTNGINISAEPVTASGAGAGGAGAIINTGPQQTTTVTNVTLAGDTTFGGTHTVYNTTLLNSGRWDIRGTSATLSTGGQPYNLTKTGNNQIAIVAAAVDAALANITINGGALCFQTTTNSMGDPTKALTINPGGILGFYNTTAVMSKVTEINGGTLWAESGSGANNTFAGTITIDAAGATFDTGGVLGGGDPAAPHNTAVMTLSGPITGVGGVSKTGSGTVFITGLINYAGDTTVNAGTLQINTPSTTGTSALNNVSGAAATLGIGNGTVATNVTADSINVGTLTLGAGSTLSINAIPGGPSARARSISPVPEPSTWAMLLLAVTGLGIYWRRNR